jgi:hypothetical protein
VKGEASARGSESSSLKVPVGSACTVSWTSKSESSGSEMRLGGGRACIGLPLTPAAANGDLPGEPALIGLARIAGELPGLAEGEAKPPGGAGKGPLGTAPILPLPGPFGGTCGEGPRAGTTGACFLRDPGALDDPEADKGEGFGGELPGGAVAGSLGSGALPFAARGRGATFGGAAPVGRGGKEPIDGGLLPMGTTLGGAVAGGSVPEDGGVDGLAVASASEEGELESSLGAAGGGIEGGGVALKVALGAAVSALGACGSGRIM